MWLTRTQEYMAVKRNMLHCMCPRYKSFHEARADQMRIYGACSFTQLASTREQLTPVD